MVEVHLDAVEVHLDVEDPFGLVAVACTGHNQAGLTEDILDNAVAVVAGNYLQVGVGHIDHAVDSFDLVVDIRPEGTLVAAAVLENLEAVVQNILGIGCNLDTEDNLD